MSLLASPTGYLAQRVGHLATARVRPDPSASAELPLPLF